MKNPILPLMSAIALLGAPLALAPTAEAQSVRQDWMASGQRDGDREILQVREIIEMVRRQVGGEYQSFQRLERGANPPFYVLRWRFGERTEDLRVNALTGQVMGR